MRFCTDGFMADSNAFDNVTSVDARRAAEALIVDVDGFEGPLDLLLTLSRTQKVDLRKISVLALAEQYLGFIDQAKELRIELAADYLVMAAWLAFLKSRLLLPPDPKDEGPSGEELAAHLAFQLERLAAMRDCAARLMGARPEGPRFLCARRARGRDPHPARDLYRDAAGPDAGLCAASAPATISAPTRWTATVF